MATLVAVPRSLFSKLTKTLPLVLRSKLRKKNRDSHRHPSTTVTTPPKNTKCHLLALPAELRNVIYEYTLSESFPTIKLSDRRKHKTHRSPAQPPITRVCRQLRNETLAMFYSITPFCFMASSIQRLGSKMQVKTKALAPLAPYITLMKDIQIVLQSRKHTRPPTVDVHFDLNRRIMSAKIIDWRVLQYRNPLGGGGIVVRHLGDPWLLEKNKRKVHAEGRRLLDAVESRGEGGGVYFDEIVAFVQMVRVIYAFVESKRWRVH